MNIRRCFLVGFGAASSGALLSGCGVVSTVAGTLNAPPASPPLAVPSAIFEVVADMDLNPDGTGISKPLLFRLYELRSGAAFERASYFDLQDKDEAQMGSDLVRREEFIFAPGQRSVIERKGNADVRVFGLFAAYRDLDRATWRTLAVAPNSVELRRRWLGLGPTERVSPVHYKVQLTRDAVRVHLLPPTTK